MTGQFFHDAHARFSTTYKRGPQQISAVIYSAALLFKYKRRLLKDNIRRYAVHYSAAACLMSAPAIVAFFLGNQAMLRGFEESGRSTNLQVAELLKGEQLVSPPALPPEFFMTQEAVQLRPLLDGANRNWQLLNGTYMQRLLVVFKVMKEQYGYDMALLEGFRSGERQNMLASRGEHVTSAAAYQSYHQYGMAADCAFIRDGKLVITEKDAWAMEGYRLYGKVAESVGLTWGGRWQKMDFGHTELRVAGGIKHGLFEN